MREKFDRFKEVGIGIGIGIGLGDPSSTPFMCLKTERKKSLGAPKR